jgi:hypothetical protein
MNETNTENKILIIKIKAVMKTAPDITHFVISSPDNYSLIILYLLTWDTLIECGNAVFHRKNAKCNKIVKIYVGNSIEIVWSSGISNSY